MDFEETASLSIVLSLLIHKISSKHDRDTTVSMQVAFKLNASHITRITFSKMSADLYNFYFQVQSLDTFRFAANGFYSKISFAVYFRLLI